MDKQPKPYLVYCRSTHNDLATVGVTLEIAANLWIVKSTLDAGRLAAARKKLADRAVPIFVCGMQEFSGHTLSINDDAGIRSFLGADFP
jgi:hypothetical protein